MTEERQPTRFTVWRCEKCGELFGPRENELLAGWCPGHIRARRLELLEVVPASDLDKAREEIEELLDEAVSDYDELRARLDKALAALRELVRLKDGPRDEEYHQLKPEAWDRAREVVRVALDELREPA